MLLASPKLQFQTHGAQVLTVAGAHHMTVLDALADPASSLAKAAQTLIQSAE